MNEMKLADLLQGKADMMGGGQPQPMPMTQPGQGQPMPSEQEIMMAGMIALGLMPPPGGQGQPRK